jgi:cystathionine beta-synthase
VLSAEPPIVMGEVVGSIDEKSLVDAVFSGRVALTDSVAGLIGPRFALIGMHETVESAREQLRDADALMVTSDGKPAALLTRHDLLTFLNR